MCLSKISPGCCLGKRKEQKASLEFWDSIVTVVAFLSWIFQDILGYKDSRR